MNFELVGWGHALACVDKNVREEEEHSLLVALARQLVKTTLSNKMLQHGAKNKELPSYSNNHIVLYL